MTVAPGAQNFASAAEGVILKATLCFRLVGV